MKKKSSADVRDNHGQVQGMKKDIYFKLQTATYQKHLLQQ